MELFALGWVVSSSGYDSNEVLCPYEWHTFSVDAKLLLTVVQEVAKVYVEHLRRKYRELEIRIILAFLGFSQENSPLHCNFNVLKAFRLRTLCYKM